MAEPAASVHPPPKLPYMATLVVRASRMLGWTAKAVWLEQYSLQPPGAPVADLDVGRLADRLGVPLDTVRRQVEHLVRLGLFDATPERSAALWATLPPTCVPSGAWPPSSVGVQDCVSRLDAFITNRGFRPSSAGALQLHAALKSLVGRLRDLDFAHGFEEELAAADVALAEGLE